MTIRYLEIFVEVCKYMNMSRAAQSLMISQSSVSQAVKALEKEYNVLLFERLNHNLYLTAAGEKMLYLATQVLKSIGRLNSAMHNAPVSLNIGSCNTVGASFLYPLLAEFKKLSPDIDKQYPNLNGENFKQQPRSGNSSGNGAAGFF